LDKVCFLKTFRNDTEIQINDIFQSTIFLIGFTQLSK